jgi:CRP/FNR family transcriptional regulator
MHDNQLGSKQENLNKKHCTLGKLSYFKGADKNKLKELEKMFQKREYKKGEIVLKQEDQGRIYILKKGKLERYRITSEGKKFILEIHNVGSIFGCLSIKTPEDIFVEAIENSYIYTINADTFFQLMCQMPGSVEKVFEHFTQRLFDTQQKAISLATDDVRVRLIKQLLFLGNINEHANLDQSITDPFTHEHLSQMTGVSRQTVTIILNQLKRKKLVRRIKKRFVFDREKLEKMIS